MADIKASAFSGIGTWSALADGDLFPFVDISGTGAAKNSVATYLEMKTALSTVLLPLTGGTMTGALTLTPSTANTGILASTGYSLTGSDATSMIDLAGTWDTLGTPTAIKLNITNTASNAASKLLDLQVGGVTAFGVQVNSGGNVKAFFGTRGANIDTTDDYTTVLNGYFGVLMQQNSGGVNCIGGSLFSIGVGADLILGRAAAAILQLGRNDATTPTAQTLVSHSVTTGTGANMIIGAGTGSVAGGSVILATRATTGALTARVTVAANGEVTIVLPTSAGTAGSLWNDTGTVKVA